MLTQRKRFNYNVTCSRGSTSQNKTYVSSAIKTNGHKEREDVDLSKFRQEKQNSKKVQELEEVNKRLIEQTTKQFKKLEADVQRVEKILQEKQAALESSHQYNQTLKATLQTVEDQKKMLIEAIFQKDLVIREYQQKLKELLAATLPKTATTPINSTTPEKQARPESEQSGVQTEPLGQSCPRQQLNAVVYQNMQLQQQLYRVREQLFDANNKIRVQQQQFQAYKILRQIQSVQQM